MLSYVIKREAQREALTFFRCSGQNDSRKQTQKCITQDYGKSFKNKKVRPFLQNLERIDSSLLPTCI